MINIFDFHKPNSNNVDFESKAFGFIIVIFLLNFCSFLIFFIMYLVTLSIWLLFVYYFFIYLLIFVIQIF